MESQILKRQKENSPSQAVMKEGRMGPDTRLRREIDGYNSHSLMNILILLFIAAPYHVWGTM